MTRTKPPPQQQDIILDTCILQYSGSDPKRGAPFTAYLDELVKRGFELAISNFTIYELLQGVTAEKEKKLAKVLSSFKRIEITERLLVTAARLHALYRQDKVPDSQISDGDKIIAATAILRGALIATTNLRDFPRPFFTEVEIKKISYKKGRVPVMLPIFILTPYYSVIRDRFDKRP